MSAAAQPLRIWRPAAVAFGAAGLGAMLVGVWLLWNFDPSATGSWFPSCVFHDLTGWYCPGCGITRALHALVHFDLKRALAMNAFLVTSLPLLALMAAQGLMQKSLLPRPVARVAFDGRWWIGALVVFGVLRNLPGLEWLAPVGAL
ncbi:DUF2752 domain-containing protein [Lysobacter tyrosinilyticus]